LILAFKSFLGVVLDEVWNKPIVIKKSNSLGEWGRGRVEKRLGLGFDWWFDQFYVAYFGCGAGCIYNSGLYD
jgi:hypothetical protein